jgi:hypothetical protein
MSFDWLTWSNPISMWWAFLLSVSIVNVTLWLSLNRRLGARDRRAGTFRIELLVLLSAAYVFGCAFRAVLPRADVERICLFDTWLSSVIVGRSVATVAELCFAIQWAIILHCLARAAQSGVARTIANSIVPMILLAEGFSWYAVITTNYLGNAIENSLWTVTFLGVAAGLVVLMNRFGGALQLVLGSAVAGIIGYAAFMLVVDLPMYFGRWHADLANGKELFGFLAGLHDVSSRWVVTHDIARWKDEIAWKSLYFSVAVWTSLALCGFVLIRSRLPRYRKMQGNWSLASQRLFARAGAA